jgi:hypothetical protein
MKDYIKVEGHQNLRRDSLSGAIVNVDDNEYLNYMKIKNKRKKDRCEIENLKDEVSQLKYLMQQLFEKLN